MTNNTLNINTLRHGKTLTPSTARALIRQYGSDCEIKHGHDTIMYNSLDAMAEAVADTDVFEFSSIGGQCSLKRYYQEHGERLEVSIALEGLEIDTCQASPLDLILRGVSFSDHNRRINREGYETRA